MFTSSRRRASVVVAVLLALSATVFAGPAARADYLTDYIKIVSTSVSSTTGDVTIKYENRLPAGAISASVGFQLGGGGREGTLQQQTLKSGTNTVTLKPGKVVRAIKVIITVAGGHVSSSKSYWVLIGPSTRTSFHTVTAYEATAQRVSLAIVGIALLFVPSNGTTQAIGAALTGWDLGLSIAEGLGFGGCPRAVKGQYIRTIQTTTISSTGTVSLKVRLTTWNSQGSYALGANPVCDRTDYASLR